MLESLLIRVDSNPEIASGHLMRCLSIASKVQKQGFKVFFLMSDDRNRAIVEEKGFMYVNLNTNWKDLDSEIDRVYGLVKNYKNSILLIDSYSITSHYVTTLQQQLPVVYLGSKINDIGHPDGIINYSSKIDYDLYNSNFRSSELLLGVRYAPLRDEFQNAIVETPKEFTDLIVTTGGTDKPHFIESFITRNLKLLDRLDLNCHIVVGGMFDNIKKLENLANFSSRIKLHHKVNDMASLMRGCQMAVSANGTTVYELAACGIPTISFALAKEQEVSGVSLGDMGIVDYCGLYVGNEINCQDRISEKIEYYAQNAEDRNRLGRNANSMIDGRGCGYIAEFIKKIREKW